MSLGYTERAPSLLDSLFTHPLVHLAGPPGAGKSLLLLLYLGGRAIQHDESTLWIDCGGSFPPSRVHALFGPQAPAVLQHVFVARPASLPALKQVAAEVANRGCPPGVRHVVCDPASRLPRLALSQSVNSAPGAGYVSDDFFAGAVEPLVFAAARDDATLYLAHEQSQDRPFWWGRYPAPDCCVTFSVVATRPKLREVRADFAGKKCHLDLSQVPPRVTPLDPSIAGEDEDIEPPAKRLAARRMF